MPYTGEYVESLGVSRDKVLWIPHGVELERYKDLAPYTGDVNGQFRVMFLGGFVASNSVDTILDAAAVLRRRGRMDVKFLLVGSGTDKDALIRRVREQGLTNVDFPAPVPKRDIARVMGQADAFIYGLRDLPLYRFGVVLNKLTDYLASQRPIIFFGKSPYDPVRDVGAGYSVPPGRPEAIADAIEQLTALTPGGARGDGSKRAALPRGAPQHPAARGSACSLRSPAVRRTRISASSPMRDATSLVCRERKRAAPRPDDDGHDSIPKSSRAASAREGFFRSAAVGSCKSPRASACA